MNRCSSTFNLLSLSLNRLSQGIRMAEIQSQFVCNMTALSREQRARHSMLKAALAANLVSHRELRQGYAFAIDAETVSDEEMREWMDLETKCCPFFRLGFSRAVDRW